MTTEKFHKIFLLASFTILMFIVLDTYVFPKKNALEIVKSKEFFSQRQHMYSTVNTYTIHTNKRTFDARYDLYSLISADDTLMTSSSILTNTIQKVSFQGRDRLYIYEVGYLNAFFGLFAVPFTLLLLILFFIFYRKLNNLQGRKNLTYAILICTLIQLFFYLAN